MKFLKHLVVNYLQENKLYYIIKSPHDDVTRMSHTAYGTNLSWFEDWKMTIKSARWYFLNGVIKNYQRGKGKRADKDVQAGTCPYPPNSVTHNICGSSFSRGWLFFLFFLILQLFCNFCNNFCVFVYFLVVFDGSCFLFRYWRHLPIHVESELIKHLSRFSSSSFSKFIY